MHVIGRIRTVKRSRPQLKTSTAARVHEKEGRPRLVPEPSDPTGQQRSYFFFVQRKSEMMVGGELMMEVAPLPEEFMASASVVSLSAGSKIEQEEGGWKRREGGRARTLKKKDKRKVRH